MTVSEPLMELTRVEVGYAGSGPRGTPHLVSRPLDIHVEKGEFICLLGPNGSGKSTLLRTLAGAQGPLSGSIRILGDELASIPRRELAQRVAVVLTDPIHSWALSGYELVALGRLPYVNWSGRLSPHDHLAVEGALRRANATDLAHRPIQELSDGERQRMLLARALAQDASILLLDEITAFLDLPHRLEVMRLLGELVLDDRRSVILSTHDLELALRTADRIWLLPGDGSLLDGAPEDLVLSGDIHNAFAHYGVRFDADSGHFDWESHARGTVALTGEGRAAIWAARALRRCGFRVVTPPAPADARIRAISWEDGHRWILQRHGQTEEHLSLRGLTRSLRKATGPGESAGATTP